MTVILKHQMHMCSVGQQLTAELLIRDLLLQSSRVVREHIGQIGLDVVLMFLKQQITLILWS